MPRPRKREPEEIEFHSSPHPFRPGWRVLRITYHGQRHDAQIYAALRHLVTPDQDASADVVEPQPQDGD
jgi:hypothetical protein